MSPARPRAVEGPEGRRARLRSLAVAVGRGPTGLAHRMLRHGRPLPGPGVRHPWWRTRPSLPAPRKRTGPVRGVRRRVRELLDAQRPRARERPEDVEVAG